MTEKAFETAILSLMKGRQFFNDCNYTKSKGKLVEAKIIINLLIKDCDDSVRNLGKEDLCCQEQLEATMKGIM